MGRPRFTPADVEQMKALHAGGLSITKIGQHFSTTHNVISRYLRGGVRQHDENWWWPTMRKLTDAQVAEARRRIESGDSIRNVSRDFGVAYTTVRNALLRGYRGYRNQHTRAA